MAYDAQLMTDHTVLDEKYDVFKLVEDDSGAFTQQKLPPGEYFVLRSRDLFASGTLRAYACAIMTFLESAEVPGVVVDEDLLARMEHLLDYTTSLAAEWEQKDRKIPD